MDENLLVLHLARDKTNQLTAEGSKRAWLFISNVSLRLQGYFIFKIIRFFFLSSSPENALVCKGNTRLHVGPECTCES